jgi:hypothetical protein
VTQEVIQVSDEYTAIEIRIYPQNTSTGTYPVEAMIDDGQAFAGELSHERLDGIQKLFNESEIDLRGYSIKLFEALFSGFFVTAYSKSTGLAEAKSGGRLRVRLWIHDQAVELHAIPWERLYHIHKGTYAALAASALTPFSRYTALPVPEPQPVTQRPIRMLYVISNPGNLSALKLKPLDAEKELRILRQAVGDLRRNDEVRVTILPGRSRAEIPQGLLTELGKEGYDIVPDAGMTSLDSILTILQSPPGHHILHFVGHGQFSKKVGHHFLFLEKEDGTYERLMDEVLVQKLGQMDQTPHLVFLAACESAMREPGAEHPFVGLGPKLVKAGVPAVVAMQDWVRMDVAQDLTGHFYRRLLDHGVIDRALNEARNIVFKKDSPEWAKPVLFMRLKTGQLFAPDPVRTTLKAIRDWAADTRAPMGIEVVHLVGEQDRGSLERFGQEPVASVDLVSAALRVFAPREEEGRPGLVVLVGAHGTAKTTELRRIAWKTADISLSQGPADRQVIPTYVDLRAYPAERAGPRNPVEMLALKSLRNFWPGLTATTLSDLPQHGSSFILRLLLDGSDDLPDTQRWEAWRKTKEMMESYPEDDYMLVINSDHFVPSRVKHATDLLVIQPLSRRAVEAFLKTPENEPFGSRLYKALGDWQLFDLTAVPWLLRSMLEQAHGGIYPTSRAKVVQAWVEASLAEISSEHGGPSQAEETVYALAWEMQSARSSTWAVRDAFRTMTAVRGNREYSLEKLYDALVDSGLFVRVGHDMMRFAYPCIQWYCCAMAIERMADDDRDRILDDITASLGRLIRLRWWEETLVLLSGLTGKPKRLHQKLLYGASLDEAERMFLAARCLRETSSQRKVNPEVVVQVVEALAWQLDSANVRQTSRRLRAVQALEQLRHLPAARSAVVYLGRIADQRVRMNWKGEMDYDLSGMRKAAVFALRRMMSQFRDSLAMASPELLKFFERWESEDVGKLIGWLRQGDRRRAPLAAFALADLHSSQRQEPLDALIEVFLAPRTTNTTRWAVADAFTLLDPIVVNRRVILPFLDQDAASEVGLDDVAWQTRAGHYGRLAYLIGKLGIQDPATRAFLDRCLRDFRRVSLKAGAIQSLGWLRDHSKKLLFEQIAVGNLAGQFRDKDGTKNVTEEFRLGEASEDDKRLLRRKAIEALANIGDSDTLVLLRQSRAEPSWDEQFNWDPELDQAFYEAAEEISWRVSLGGAVR